MKKSLFVIAFILLCNFLFSQTENLRAYADAMISDLTKESYTEFTKKLYQPIVEMGGGQNLYADYIKSVKDAFKKSGFKTVKYEFFENSDVVKAGEEIHATVSYIHYLQMSDKFFQGKVHFLAISSDQGKTWSFVDLEMFDLPSIKDFIPHYNDALKFPELEYPVQMDK